MDEHQQKLVEYIHTQIQSGLTQAEITAQLKNAGWPEDRITSGFQQRQEQLAASIKSPAQENDPHPTAAHTNAQAFAVNDEPPSADGKKRGSFKTGWIIFKQALYILKGNRYLLRYLGMTWLIYFICWIALTALMYFCYKLVTDDSGNSNAFYYIYVFLAYILLGFIINFYAAALSSNLLDIFRGESKPYKYYIANARAHALPILVFSIFDAIVGMLIRIIVERLGRIAGMVVSFLLGTIWSVGMMFVLPTIMAEKVSAPQAMRKSIGFVKQTWGEGIVAKISVNTPFALVTITIIVLFEVFAYFLFGSLGYAGIVFWYITFLFIVLPALVTVAIVGSFANSVLNAAMYYYATTGQVPPGFSSDMLNKIFIKRGGVLKKLHL